MRLLLIVAALVLCLAPAAQAQVYVSQVTYFDPPQIVLDAAAVADQQWTDYGRTDVAEHPVQWGLYEVGPDGGTFPAAQVIAFNRTLMDARLAQIASPDPVVRRSGLHDLCVLLTHEMGHILGYLDNDPAHGAGIMTSQMWVVWPPRCQEWVDGLAPSPPPGVTDPYIPPNAPPVSRAKGHRYIIGTLGTTYSTVRHRQAARLFAARLKARHHR